MSTPANASGSTAARRYGVMLALVLATLIYLPMRLAMETLDAASTTYVLFYLYGTLLQIVFAAAIIAVAVKIGVRQAVGKQWLLLGIGVGMFAIGDVIWSVFELFMKIDPYPSVADVFYVAEYAFFVAAIVLAIRGYAGLVSIRNPMLIAGAVALVGVIANYLLLLQPYIFPTGIEELGFWGLVVSTLYPVGDVVFMLAPAVALALVVAQLGMGRLARPWWAVVAGALVFALADSLYAYADWAGGGVTPVMDMGWIAANLLFAIAALIARNAYRTT